MRFLMTLLLLAATGRAATFDEANEQYAAGDYAKAAEQLEQVIASEGPSAARLFNLGNARFRMGQHGPAILAYEQARLLAPRDSDIITNLKVARDAAKTTDPAPNREWWQSIFYAASLHEWSWLTLGAAILAALPALLAGCFGWGKPAWKRSGFAAIVTGIILTALGSTALWMRRSEATMGIITAKDPILKLSPFKDAGDAASPGTGRRVEIGPLKDGWVYLTVPDSTIAGWLPERDVGRLIP